MQNLQEFNHLVLTKRDWRCTYEEDGNRIHGFRDLIRFVNLLDVPGLTVQFIGYTVAGMKPNLQSKLQLLGAKRGTIVHPTRARNQHRNAALDHLGIRFGCTLQKEGTPQVNSSDAFRYVMAIAAICKVWQQSTQQDESSCEYKEAGCDQILSVAVQKLRIPKDRNKIAEDTKKFAEQLRLIP